MLPSPSQSASFKTLVIAAVQSIPRHRTAQRPTPRRRLAAARYALVSLASTFLVFGCARDSEIEENALRLTDFVAHQESNASTDFISAIESIGLDRIEYGLHKREFENPDNTSFEILHGMGRLKIFSADGDLVSLDLEAGLPQWATDQKLKLTVKLNNKRVSRLTLTPGIDAYRIEVPSAIAVQGTNRLEFQPRPSRKQRESGSVPTALIRRIRVRSNSARRFWPLKPDRIQVVDSSEKAMPSTIEMPTAAYMDMVLEVPSEGRLVGSVSSRAAPNEDQNTIEIYARLMDDDLTEQTLVSEQREAGEKRSRRFEFDLGSWAGKIVRLRFGVSGSGNAVVSWRNVRIVSSGSDRVLDLDPIIEPVSPPRTGRLGRPDILIILLDAARADAFSPFGSERRTPALERLATDGTRFSGAISTSPWTGQSVPSIFAGLFADTIGIGAWGSNLPDSVPTMAELMTKAGYRTVLWTQHPFYRNRQSLKRGFQEFRQAPRGKYDSVPDPKLLVDDERPTFAWVHFIPPHTPYRPPAPFFGSDSSWYTGGISAEATFLNRFPRKLDPNILSADDRRYIRDRYQENAAFADDLVRRVVEAYDVSGRYDDSLIVVLSDHGEAFLEHGRFLHTRYVHREFLHVPFVIKWPAALGEVRTSVDEMVPLTDLLPTLIDGLALESPGGGFQGRSILPVVLDDKPRPGPYYAVTRGVADRSKSPQPETMLQQDGWRILYDPLNDRSKLYRHHDDPNEQSDLAERFPMRALLLRQTVLRQMAANQSLLNVSSGDDPERELDPEVVEQLQALGYLN